jgi:N6-L-threonylcarbamoyladenine synthase
MLSNVVAGQKIHEQYGGVVPELASRAHEKHIVPLIAETLSKANITKEELSAIAFTAGPGLIGSLMVGCSFAKAMALALNIPLITVNHMQAHILAHFIDEPKPAFPFLCLTVSGGHTQLVKVTDYFSHEVIGKTIDDAAGEAFDKAAKILGLPYPGGPLIDKYAQAGQATKFEFPVSNMANLDYSFSGLKTSILYFVRDRVAENPNFVEDNLADLCASIQHAIIKQLMKKLVLAAKQTNIKHVALAGGVSANSGLRHALELEGKKRNWKTFIPDFQYCTDNAGMIAIAAHYKFLEEDFATQQAAPYAR